MIKTYTINVTKKDILLGIRRHETLCPIGLAVTRRTGQTVKIGCQFIEIGKNWPELKGRVLEWLKNFDTGYEEVKPIRFNIEVEE
jgi:hypothetical protein